MAKTHGWMSLAGVCAHDANPQNLAPFADNGLDQAGGLSFGLGPVIVMKRPADNLDGRAKFFLRFRLREAHLGQFRIGEGHMRNDVRAVRDRQAEQGVPDDQPRMIVGHMGKLQSARHVANRIDMFLR